MKANYKHIEDYLEQAETLQLAGFDALRQQAANDLQHFGFPTAKTESWKYTSVKSLLSEVYQVAEKETVALEDIKQFLLADAYSMVVVNGYVDTALSNIDTTAIKLTHLHNPGQLVSTAQTGFTALNSLLFSEGYRLEVVGTLDKPLHILHVATQVDDEVIYHRQQIALSAKARAEIIEQFVSLDSEAYWRNSVSEITLAETALLNYAQLTQEENTAKHTGYMAVSLQKQSRFYHFSMDLSGQLIRHDLLVKLMAENASCDLQGLYLARDKQHVDNHTAIEHLHPHTFSNECYKGILNDKSHAVFNGRVLVAKDAQKVDSSQKNANLLLSNDCEIDTKPELEIYADDVKCAHGATVGQLDAKAVFYLQSRGIDQEMAEKLLTYGFAYDAVETIENKILHDFFTEHLASWFIDDAQLQRLML